MPDEMEGSVDATGNAHAPKQSPDPPLPPAVEGHKDGEGNDDHNRRKSITEHKPPKHWVEYLEGLCAVALVAITATYTYYAREQASAGITAANAARGAVCIATRTLAETVRSNKSQEAANVRSFNATVENFHREQRAWVTPSDDAMHQTPLGIYFDVSFTNTGKTLGIHIRGILTGTSDPTQIPAWDKDPGGNGANLAPGSSFHLTSAKNPLSEAALTANRAGLPLNLYGTVWYDDIFERKHWIQFCDQTSGSLTDFGPCPIHNLSSDSSPIKRAPQERP